MEAAVREGIAPRLNLRYCHTGMTHTGKAMLLALSLAMSLGCDAASDEPPLMIDEPRLAMKCSFSARSTTRAMPGEAFLYLLYDARNDPYVVHGIARDQEDLTSAEMGLWGDLPPHAAWRELGYKWTERAGGDAVTNWIGGANSVGELFINTGVSHLSEVAYPGCFAREL
jgi:hypothetical protein